MEEASFLRVVLYRLRCGLYTIWRFIISGNVVALSVEIVIQKAILKKAKKPTTKLAEPWYFAHV